MSMAHLVKKQVSLAFRFGVDRARERDALGLRLDVSHRDEHKRSDEKHG